MRATELIEQLQVLVTEHGDLPVILIDEDGDALEPTPELNTDDADATVFVL